MNLQGTKDKYAKLRCLLGQQTTAAKNLRFWLRAETAPTEQWHGQAAIQRKIIESRATLDSIEHELQNEMRARLGVPSGTLTIQRVEEVL